MALKNSFFSSKNPRLHRYCLDNRLLKSIFIIKHLFNYLINVLTQQQIIILSDTLLSLLRSARLLSAERQGKKMYYKIFDEHVRCILDMIKHFTEEKEG